MSDTLSYPFPVLGNGDDVSGTLPGFELQQILDGTTLTLSLLPRPLRCGNRIIDGLVAQGAAKWFLRVHCARSYYRREVELEPEEPRVRLSTDDIEGTTTAELFVIATRSVPGYRPEGLHSDYGDTTFDVSAGEVLAMLCEFEFLVEPRFDPMRADPKSFIHFEKLEDEASGPFRIDPGGDTVIVYLPRNEWELVNELKEDVPELLHACLALPALVCAIQQREGGVESDTRRWAARLSSLLRLRGLDGRDPFEAAQELLQNPLSRGLAQTETAIRPQVG